jgi:transcription antitermination factor NusG
VGFVKFGGKIEHVSDRQIEMVRTMLDSGEQIDIDNEDYEIGDRVEVINGPLTGLEGNLVEKRGKHKLLIYIEVIGQNLSADIPVAYLRKIKN